MPRVDGCSSAAGCWSVALAAGTGCGCRPADGAFPLAAGPDSLLPLPGRLQLAVGPVLPLLPLLAVVVVLLLLLSLLAAIDALL